MKNILFLCLVSLFSNGIIAQSNEIDLNSLWDNMVENTNSIEDITINTNPDSLNFCFKELELFTAHEKQFGFVKFKLTDNADQKLALLFNSNEVINWGIMTTDVDNKFMSILPCYGSFNGMMDDATYYIDGIPQSRLALHDSEIIAHYSYCMDENCLELEKEYILWFEIYQEIKIDHTKFPLFLSINAFNTEAEEMGFFTNLTDSKTIEHLSIKENFDN